MDQILTLPHSPSTQAFRAKALVFHSPGSLSLLGDVERVARSEATVLVTGETGTGKELIARHIHAVSGRRGPFLAVNCGAFSESLIDAELFGHEAGAFTGASSARAGWFEAAEGGTLFLDEIGDLPLTLQVKLLRVLQERQVVRLGSRRSIALDVRLVTATNIDLARAVAVQRFRADLYYRLSVATIRLPPLRERPADIIPLARHFIGVYSSRLKLGDIVLSEDAQSALLRYSWPGNIRELENAIHFSLIVCQDGVVRAEDIKTVHIGTTLGHAGSAASAFEVPDRVPEATTPTALDAVFSSRSNDYEPTTVSSTKSSTAMEQLVHAWKILLSEGQPRLFDQVESELIRAAFTHAAENQVRTAKVLGITRNTLRTFLKRHGLLRGVEDAREDALVNTGG